MDRSDNRTCPDEDTLLGFCFGGGTDADIVAVEAHLLQCEACEALVAQALLDGTLLGGRYRLKRVVGFGASGVVYEAFDETLQRRVAVKTLHQQAPASFESEAHALAQIHHPYVVSIFDAGAHADGSFIVTSYVDGSTLREWSSAQRRGWREVAALFAQVADGLAAIHGSGFAHRDIKPDNILIDRKGNAFVGDLGFALGAHRNGDERIAGTRRYMAPELGRDVFGDARSDMFAFAVSLKEAVQDANAPAWLHRLIARGLREDPAERLQDAREAAALLRRGLHGRQHRLRAAALACVAVFAVVYGVQQHTCSQERAAWLSEWTAARQMISGSVGDELQRWASLWLARHDAVCLSPTERKSQLSCLRDGWTTFTVKTKLVTERQDVSPDQAMAIVDTLPALSACERVRDFGEQAARHDVALDTAVGLVEIGRYAEARPLLENALAAAEPSPAHARALASLAFAERYVDVERANERCFEAKVAAEALHADLLRAEIIATCIAVASIVTRDEPIPRLLRELEAIMAHRSVPLSTEASYRIALAYAAAPAESLPRWREALALTEQLDLPKPRQLITASVNVCGAASGTASVKQDCLAALALIRRLLGDVDAMAMPEETLARTARDEGDLSAALQWSEAALRHAAKVLAPGHPRLVYFTTLHAQIAEEAKATKQKPPL